MTSNNRFPAGRRFSGGFTLVEIILALAIGVVLMGGAAVLLTTRAGERDLDDTRKLLQEEVRQARVAALRGGAKQVVVLNVSQVGGQPFPGGVQMDLITPRDLALGLKGWGRPLDYQWSVTGGGLVEPIRVRLRKGEMAEQFSFSALTGEIVYEAPEAP